MADVESFTLDHTAVLAPYVRRIGTETGPRGDVIVWGAPEIATLVNAITDSLRAIAEDVTWEDVPGTDAFSCGNYRDHSLHSAREWSKVVLETGISFFF